MRNRSVTIYALDEKDFKSQMPSYTTNSSPDESPKSKRKRSSKISSHIESLNNSCINKYDNVHLEYENEDMLSYVKNFSLEVLQPTFKEKLLQEEENIKNKVINCKIKYQNLDTKEKFNLLLSKKNIYNSSSNISALKSTFDNSITSLVPNDSEEFINQNFKFEEKTIKCLLLGDRQVGKTALKNKLIDEFNNQNSFKPTSMLEIKKKHYICNKKIIKLETIDTNVTIQNSPLIKTYFKISNILIFVCNAFNKESILFISKQISKVSEIKDNYKMLIIVNIFKTYNNTINNSIILDNNSKNNDSKINLTNCNITSKNYNTNVDILNGYSKINKQLDNYYNSSYNNNIIADNVIDENLKLIEKLSKQYSIPYEIICINDLVICQDLNNSIINSNSIEIKNLIDRASK